MAMGFSGIYAYHFSWEDGPNGEMFIFIVYLSHSKWYVFLIEHENGSVIEKDSRDAYILEEEFPSKGVTPRSLGYGNVTVTYICRTKIPSQMYAKHQYMQESECESTMIIYIPIKQYEYTIIIECDPI